MTDRLGSPVSMVSSSAMNCAVEASEASDEQSMLQVPPPVEPQTCINQRLPPEMLMEIFSRLRPASLRDVQVAQVCRTWRQVMLRTPEAWIPFLSIPGVTRVTNPRARTCLETLLLRSAPRPLVLSSVDLSAMTCAALEPHLARLTSLSVRCPNRSISSFCNMLEQEMPNLEHLFIAHTGNLTPPRPFSARSFEALNSLTSRPDASNLPRLRTLRLPRFMIEIDFSASPISSLTVGACTCHQCHLKGTLEGVLSLLRRHPNVSRFCYMPRTARGARWHAVAGLVPVELPHLRDFVIPGPLSASWISALVSRLTVPPSTRFDVTLVPGDPQEIVPAAFRGLPIYSTSGSVQMEFCPWKKDQLAQLFIIEGDDVSRHELTVVLPPDTPGISQGIMQAFLDLFPGRASHATELVLVVESASLAAGIGFEDGLGEVLRAFENVTTLDVSAVRSRPPDRLMRALRAENEAASEELDGPLPCPRLANLVLEWSVCWEAGSSAAEFECTLGEIERTVRDRAERGARLASIEFIWDTYSRLRTVGTPEEVLEKLRSLCGPWVDSVSVDERAESE